MPKTLHLRLVIEADDNCDDERLIDELRAWTEEIPAVTPLDVLSAKLLEQDDDDDSETTHY